MNTPGFTAEVSLYTTSGHYQTVRQSIHTIGAINPSMMAEQIEVFGCGPGLWQLGEGANMTCIDPGNPWGGGGGGGGGGTPIGPHEPGGGGGGTVPKPPKPPPSSCGYPPLHCGGPPSNRGVYPGCSVTCGPGETSLCLPGSCFFRRGPVCTCQGPPYFPH